MIFWHDSLPSTMIEASRLALAGATSGTVVAAREQTAGQGRLGRDWHSELGAGLYCTVILRLAVQLSDIPAITLALGLAVVEALTALTGCVFDIRWPNDVLWDGKKCCGILARMEHGAVLAGIGINLNQRNFPEGLRTPAVSLALATGKTFDANDVLEALLPAIDTHVRIFERQGREAVLRLFSNVSSYVAGRRVIVDLDGATIAGLTEGLDEYGFLRIRKENGTLETILAGSVRPAD